jgi:hypothetical protein
MAGFYDLTDDGKRFVMITTQAHDKSARPNAAHTGKKSDKRLAV